MGSYFCSTPMKQTDDEEIDVSQRGRLRKRRIIPNNVEDQYAVKKSRPPKTEPVTESQPVIVQSGKTQFVDYADIIKKLQTNPAAKPLLFKTIRGGKTVITSVIPVSTSTCNTSAAVTMSQQEVQPVTLQSPTEVVGQPPVRMAIPGGSGRVAQHPTIHTLLSSSVGVGPASSHGNHGQ